MKCDHVKEWLTENFTVAGTPPAGDIAAHLDECAECRAYAEKLASLSADLSPLTEITLTAFESAGLEAALDTAMQTLAIPYRRSQRKKNIFAIFRIATAVAAMVLIVAVSFRTNSVDMAYPIYNVDDLELTGTSVQDLAPLFVNDNEDLLPSMVDQQAVTYLTDQVDPAQAADILESATSEEINWLMKNYSMEM